MARISKRKKNFKILVNDKINKIYNVGIYARLSSKHNDITIQIKLIRNYIENYNKEQVDKMVIYDEYFDIGKTGTNFKRKEFQRLMEDIRLQKVNCIIVKDFSRFGRNYLEVENYLNKIFPFLEVRFISILDHYDSDSIKNKEDVFTTNLKNLIHEMYAKDFSQKAKIQIEQRRNRGEYVGGVAPYGFLRNKEKKQLVIDPCVVFAVKLIYKVFEEERNYKAVIDKLNDLKINPPTIYYKTKKVCCDVEDNYKKWTKGSVYRILTNKRYKEVLEKQVMHDNKGCGFL